jgi:hypothetical protein
MDEARERAAFHWKVHQHMKQYKQYDRYALKATRLFTVGGSQYLFCPRHTADAMLDWLDGEHRPDDTCMACQWKDDEQAAFIARTEHLEPVEA